MLEKSKANYCFYMANIVLTIKMMLASSSIIQLNFGDEVLSVIFLTFIILKLFSQTYSVKDLLIFLLIGILAIYTCQETNNYYLMFSCLECFAIKDVDLNKLLKYRCMTKIVILSIHILYTISLMLVDFHSIPTIVRNGHIRYDFYLGQPNTFQMYLLWTTLELLFVNFKYIKDKQLLAAFIVNVIFYLFTNSNTSIQVLAITVIFIYAVKHEVNVGTIIVNFIAKYGYGIITIILFLFAYLYGITTGIIKVLLVGINQLMTGRLAYGAYALYNSGLTLFGHKLYLPQTTFWNEQWFDALYLDSSYMALLFEYGIIWSLIIGFGTYMCAKRKNIKLNIFLVAYILYGIMESYALNASACFPIFFLGIVYFKDRNEANVLIENESSLIK